MLTSGGRCYLAEVRLTAARALYMLPLHIRTIQVAAAGPLRAPAPGMLPPGALLTGALRVADAAMWVLLGSRDGATLDGGTGPLWADAPLHRAHVHQATGMIVVQAEVPVATALAMLRAFAFANERPIDEVAGDVVARRLSFGGGLPMTTTSHMWAATASSDEGRERAVAEVLVSLADSLVDDFDVIEMLHRSRPTAYGCSRSKHPLACCCPIGVGHSSSFRLRPSRLDYWSCSSCRKMKGHAWDSDRTSPRRHHRRSVQHGGSGGRSSWRRPADTGATPSEIHAVPLRLRADTIGALNLFQHPSPRSCPQQRPSPSARRWPTWPRSPSCRNAPSIAAMSSIEQLQTATCNSHVVIRRAKGVIAERDQTRYGRGLWRHARLAPETTGRKLAPRSRRHGGSHPQAAHSRPTEDTHEGPGLDPLLKPSSARYEPPGRIRATLASRSPMCIPAESMLTLQE